MTYENNTLYVDVDNMQHKYNYHNNTSSRIRLYIGTLGDTEFERTIESIKHLPDEKQQEVREYIKSIFLKI